MSLVASLAPSEAALPTLEARAAGDPFTFAVIGDYRGDSDGNPPQVFVEILRAIDVDAPVFALSTGDLINGYPEEDESHLRKLWRGYLKTLSAVNTRIFHVPGNHDLFHDMSARLWREFLGPTRYAFDFAGVRFIGLDTETVPGRIDAAQMEWVRAQLESAGERRVFMFVHQPLFPVDGHIGNSLDKFPAERDRLHRLLVGHRAKIEGVFLGHEHLFAFEEHDGIRYYISAGSGAPLYVPRELGGYYHYLLVHVTADSSAVELRKMRLPPTTGEPPRVIKPGEVLESWEHSTMWNFWDQALVQRRVTSPCTEGRAALQLDFNLSHYEWPSLATEFATPVDLSSVRSVKADVFLKDGVAAELTVKGGFDGEGRSESPALVLKQGWNTLELDLGARWLNPKVRQSVRKFELTFTGVVTDAVRSVVVDNIRADKAAPADPADVRTEVFEGWERPLQWGAWDETTRPAAHVEDRQRGLKMQFDIGSYPRPRIYCELHPNWDLSEIDTVVLSVFVPTPSPMVSVQMALTGALQTFPLPEQRLRPGWNQVELKVGSIGASIRRQIQRLEWWITAPERNAKGWVMFGEIRAGDPAVVKR